MTRLDCQLTQQQLDDLLDGYLPSTAAHAIELHIDRCDACKTAREAAVALRSALKQMPVPELRPDFADAALARAARQPAAVRPVVRAAARGRSRPARRWRRLDAWAGASLGAAAAAALMVMLWGIPDRAGPPLQEEPAGVRVALYEPREIGLAIDAETAMAGATLTILLEGGIDLVGFGERREVRWQTDLDAGTNLLSLPIIAHSIEEGRLTALVEHGEKTQRIDVRVRVDSTAN
jgi:predicted anti-sigma-YlaC factor YlaD